MYDRRPKSRFCGLSEANKQNREPLGEAGYGLMSRWLANGMLHRYKKPPQFARRFHRRLRSSVLYRIVAASGSLPQQNFDYVLCPALRMTGWLIVLWESFVFRGVIDAQNTLQNKKMLNLFTNRKKCGIMNLRNKPNMAFRSIFLYRDTLPFCVRKDLNLEKSTSFVFTDMDILLFVKGLFRSNRGLCFFGCVASVAHLFVCLWGIYE